MKKFLPPTQKVPSATRAPQSRGKRANLTYSITGLPPGAIVIVYDKLHQVFDRGEYQIKAIGSYTIESDGILRLRNLRDSVYSIRFQNIEQILYDIPELQIGNADYFQTLVDTSIPYPVIISGVIAGLGIDDQAFLTVYWILDSHKTDGFYEIWTKKNGDSSYQKHTTLFNPQARSFNLMPLDYTTLYYITIKTINSEGLSQGFSNIVSGITLDNPAGSGFIDTDRPINAQFFY